MSACVCFCRFIFFIELLLTLQTVFNLTLRRHFIYHIYIYRICIQYKGKRKTKNKMHGDGLPTRRKRNQTTEDLMTRELIRIYEEINAAGK